MKRFPQRNMRAVARHRGLGELPENMMIQRGDRIKQKEQFNPYQQGGDVRNVTFNDPNVASFSGSVLDLNKRVELVPYPFSILTRATETIVKGIVPYNPKRNYLLIAIDGDITNTNGYVIFEEHERGEVVTNVTMADNGIQFNAISSQLRIEFISRVPINGISVVLKADTVGNATFKGVIYEG